MAWTPEKNIVDLSPVIDNLIAYIDANQIDALTWANGGIPMPSFAAIYPNASGWLGSQFPYLMVLTQSDQGEDGETENGDVIVSTLRLRFEMAIMGTATELPLITRKYDAALRSMLVNVGAETLASGCLTETHIWPSAWPSSVYDVLRGGKSATSFLQIVQTEMEYKLMTSIS